MNCVIGVRGRRIDAGIQQLKCRAVRGPIDVVAGNWVALARWRIPCQYHPRGPPEFGARLIEKLSDVPLPVAVRSADCTALTAVAVAVKVAEVALAGTVTVLGRATAASLLVRLTTNPPVSAAAFSVTLQLSVPAPASEFELQVNELSPGVPVPLMLAIALGSAAKLLVIIRGSVILPEFVGVNCNRTVTLEPTARLIGKVVPPATEKA